MKASGPRAAGTARVQGASSGAEAVARGGAGTPAVLNSAQVVGPTQIPPGLRARACGLPTFGER